MSPTTVSAGIRNLLHRAECMAYGLATHGPWIGFTQTSAAEFQSAVEALQNAEAMFAGARDATALAGKRVIVANRALSVWLAKARLVVMLARGPKWSQSWMDTGFTLRQTNIPKRVDSRIALARSLVSFFARHPELGVAFADVTAARGRSIYERVVQSREMLQVMTIDSGTIKRQRDAAKQTLRHMMRQVVLVLGAALDGSDPRWLDFGLAQRRSHRRSYGVGEPDRTPLKKDLYNLRVAANDLICGDQIIFARRGDHGEHIGLGHDAALRGDTQPTQDP
jgi:hypothetical protein